MSVNIEKFDRDDFMSEILDYIKHKENNSTEPIRVYFWGSQHFDSRFDYESGRLEVGVMAKSEDSGLAMLVALNYIVYSNYFDDDLDHYIELDGGEFDKTSISVEKIVKILTEVSHGYRVSFGLNETYKTEVYLKGKTTKIEKKFHEVKLYNLAMIEAQL